MNAKRLFLLATIALVLGECLSASGADPTCKVIVHAPDGRYHGSGTLILDNQHAITNWHVARHHTNKTSVHFLSGEVRWVEVLETDKDADLALLEFDAVSLDPITIAADRPAVGESVKIGGFGGVANARYTTAPADEFGLTVNVLTVKSPVRQGDSGAPMRNARGELVGVLFGCDQSVTMGSDCHRVRRFLTRFRGGK